MTGRVADLPAPAPVPGTASVPGTMSAPAGGILVVGVGNTLRGDDRFGIEVARRLQAIELPSAVRVTETGIAGISLVQELLAGYDGLIVIDAVERNEPPGTLVMLEPRVPDPAQLSEWDRVEFFSDLHQADPSRIFLLARALKCLPERVRVIGCEVGDCDELLGDFTAAVEAAMPAAIEMVLQTLRDWLGDDLSSPEVPA